MNISSDKTTRLLKSKWSIALVSFLAGVLLIAGFRFATYSVDSVHYHANFSISINGERQKLDNPLLYEEVEMCTEVSEVGPTQRAHMHDNINDVVHVEDYAVTWGHFLQNLDFAVGPNFIATSSKVYQADNVNKVTFILNDKEVVNIANKVIGDKDRLLINYGSSSSEELKSAYAKVPANATEYNAKKDPASCSGSGSGSFSERFKNIL